MPLYTVLAVDTAQIQPYIFGSNRLRENIGASYLVAAATGQWVFDAVRTITANHNLTSDGQLDPQRAIERDNLDVEVVYAGGGNVVALFSTADLAKTFTRALSERVLCQAPGLRILIQQASYTWGHDLGKAVGNLLSEMKRQRSLQPASAPLAGLGVTVMCRSTAFPAVGMSQPIGDEPPLPLSAEVLAKRQVVGAAKEQLNAYLDLGADFLFPDDFELLGRTEHESSYIAVVHADGNGVGKLVEGLASRTQPPRSYIAAMRDFSQRLNEAGRRAYRETAVAIIDSVQFIEDAQIYGIPAPGTIPPVEVEVNAHDQQILPFRPIVFGGDDATFVCDGRLGLSLAVTYLNAFERHANELGLSGLTACAGVSIVKSHYPFAQAYVLANKLCDNAKAFRHRSEEKGLQAGGAIDWHYTSSGIYGDIKAIRDREYKVQTGSLTLRPVALDDQWAGARTWTAVETILSQFQDDSWQAQHNKAKALYSALRDGPHAVQRFCRLYGTTLPKIEGFINGWEIEATQGDDEVKHCGYFDSLELMDLFVPVTPVSREVADGLSTQA